MRNEKRYQLSDFDFNLPEELIAQYPVAERDKSRLLVLNRETEQVTHSAFYNSIDYLNKGDVLVFNNAKVIAARIFVNRPTGGRVEIILAQKVTLKRWLVLSNRTKRLQAGEALVSENNTGITFTVIRRVDQYLELESNVDLSDEILQGIGVMPLPPYIKRDNDQQDRDRYQTVYATESGAVAAPTAGLHFTTDLLDMIKAKGVKVVFVTLYVSLGTFQPVREDDIAKHDMHSEKYYLSGKTAAIINQARNEGRRIIAVGTTSVRVLESTFYEGKNHPGSGYTNIFIYPPYTFHAVDALFTNFHTPQSTLLMLICAFAGYDLTMHTYKLAVDEKYRFYSYGDAMLIL